MARRNRNRAQRQKKEHQNKYPKKSINPKNQNLAKNKTKIKSVYISQEDIHDFLGNGTRFWKMSQDGVSNRNK